MSKPDWKDAPEWAAWVAMDEDGSWYWYEKEPKQLPDSWFSDGKYLMATREWEVSLESRP